MATPDSILIQQGKICPYCFSPTEFASSTELYGRDYGMIYICRPCDAWVGVHKGTNIAKGRLANAELRGWKMKAHSSFDKLWKEDYKAGTAKHKARKTAYQWLAGKMGIDKKDTHIGMFDIEQCKQVVSVCDIFHTEQEEVKHTRPQPFVNITVRSIEELQAEDMVVDMREQTAKELIVKWCALHRVSSVEIQSYQVRLFTHDKKIDIFPQSRKFHDITANKRGFYRDLIKFLDAEFCN